MYFLMRFSVFMAGAASLAILTACSHGLWSSQAPARAGLGPFACVAKGLHNAGIKDMSPKYIALFAAISRQQEAAQDAAIQATIETVTALGSCDRKLYDFASQEEINLSESFLTATPPPPITGTDFERILPGAYGDDRMVPPQKSPRQ